MPGELVVKFSVHVTDENCLSITEDYLSFYGFNYTQKRIGQDIYVFFVEKMIEEELQEMTNRVNGILDYWEDK